MGAAGFLENAFRMLFGHDVFISYARTDSTTYAAKLAGELTAREFFCRLDQWGARPGRKVPPDLLAAVRRSSMLVVVGSVSSANSSAMETEIREFIPTGRFIVPIDLSGTIRSACWWPLVEGLAIVEEVQPGGAPATAPSAATLDRIVNTATFTRRTRRLRILALSALALFAVLVGLAAMAASRADTALKDRREFERQRDKARSQATESGNIAEEQRRLAAVAIIGRKSADTQRIAAEDRRKRAVDDARTQQQLAAVANHEREAADTKRAEAMTQLQRTQDRLKEQTAVAESQELARGALTLTENQERLQQAIRAGETAATDAARVALINAVLKVIDNKSSGSFAVNRDGNLVAVASEHGQGVLVDLHSGRMTQLCGSPEPIGVLSFSPNSRYLLLTRYHHRLPGENRFASEYQLWDTIAGVPVSSTQVEGRPWRVRWSPDSSLFVDLQQTRAYRVSVGSQGRLTAVEQSMQDELVYDQDVVFSEDRPLFVTYSFVLESGVSLWDFQGNKLWSSKVGRVFEIAFRNQSSRLLIVLRPILKDLEEIESLDIDTNGRPTNTLKAVSWADADYPTLSGGQLRYPWHLLDKKDSGIIGERSCSALSVNLDAGLALCARDKSAPMLFDIAAHKPVGALKEWAFEDVVGPPALSSDRKTLVIASGLNWLTAWDTTTLELRWKQKAQLVTPEFSADGKRILLRGYTTSIYQAVLDAQTGRTIGAIPHGPLVWIDRSATRLMVPQGSPFSESTPETLVVWDVDHSAELHRFGLSAVDKAEKDRDETGLKASPNLDLLLEVAHRRLRACDGRTISNPYIETSTKLNR